MQHNSITLTRSREPVFPQEPIEDEARPQYLVETPSFLPEDPGAGTEMRPSSVLFLIPRFQPEDGESGGEHHPVLFLCPEYPGGAGSDRAPVFEPEENPVGGGSRRPIRMRGPRFPEDPSGGGEGPLYLVVPIHGGDGHCPEAPGGGAGIEDFVPLLCPDTCGGGGNDSPILAGPFVARLSMLGPVWPDEDGTKGGKVYPGATPRNLVESPEFPEERDGKGGKVHASNSMYPSSLLGQASHPLLPQFPTEKGSTGEGDEDGRYLQEVVR